MPTPLPLPELPIDEVLPGLVEKLRTGRNAVLVAPPGAGKTTRVPPALLRELAPAGRIVMLQPRRVAARAAARRIAAENGWILGEEVGYQVRFDRQWRADSRIVVVTEGILVQWLQADPFLDGTSIVLFDEFHERSLSVDLALAMARKVQREVRSESSAGGDLRLIAMSATLSGEIRERLIGFLDGPVVESHGRLHPVDVSYDERVDDRPLELRVATAVRRSLRDSSGGGGDVLVFLPGVGEIRRTQEALGDLVGIAVLPLHGDLPAEQQDAALSSTRGGARRVVLATNVAETSVTVEGVRTVIDGGLVRTLRFDPATGLDSLVLGRVSRASADQRAGRAGREAPGSCIRLWTQSDDRALQPAERPEIARVDLAGAALELLAWGETDLAKFAWFEPPPAERLASALALLGQLGALDEHGLTTLGRAMARLPVAPRLARLVLEGGRLGALDAASEIAALLSERRPRGNAPAVRSARSDLLIERDTLRTGERSRVRAVAKRIEQAGRRAIEWESAAKPGQRPIDEETALLRAIVAAYPDRVARKRSADPAEDRAVLVGGRGVRLGRESAVRTEPLFVAIELDDRGTEARVRTASAAEVGWLDQDLLRTEIRLRFDDARERVVAVQSTLYLDLFLDERERPIPAQSQNGAEALLIEAASRRLARALSLDDPHLLGLRARWNWLSTAMPDLALPRCDDERIRHLLPELAMGARSFADLRRAPLADRLLQELEPRQRAALDRHAPERLQVPSGSTVRLDYESGAIPILAVRIQEMFGVAETPRLAGGRIPVLIHLLAPNGRPQQVTQDLASFWKNTYPIVKRELAARYPRHAWPDDPAHAPPQRRPARR